MPAPSRSESGRAVDEAFGTVLRQLREKRGLSQETLGNDIDSARTYISELERGERGPSLKMVFRLAERLDVSAARIVKLVEENLR